MIKVVLNLKQFIIGDDMAYELADAVRENFARLGLSRGDSVKIMAFFAGG